tara:strand:- start:56 stop:442 length:387 start_codon:yes stop_codon:yes gene_type:complete
MKTLKQQMKRFGTKNISKESINKKQTSVQQQNSSADNSSKPTTSKSSPIFRENMKRFNTKNLNEQDQPLGTDPSIFKELGEFLLMIAAPKKLSKLSPEMIKKMEDLKKEIEGSAKGIGGGLDWDGKEM